MSFKVCPKPSMTPASGKDRTKYRKGLFHEVTYPVSYRYNGGIVIDDVWYEGYEVPKPDVPKGWELVNIGVGLQLNARPPYATMVLKPIK